MIGSKNPAKVEAVQEFFKGRFETEVQFSPVPSPSGVSEQPLTLSETIDGACNRAAHAFTNAEGAALSIGLEGGLTPIQQAHTGYMNICAASVFDGSEHYIGLSSGFEHPASAIKLVVEEGQEIRDAYVEAGLESSDSFSKQGGAIGFMSDQKLSRAAYCQQALLVAYASYTKRTLLRLNG